MTRTIHAIMGAVLGVSLVAATPVASAAAEFVVLSNQKHGPGSAASIVKRSDGHQYVGLYATANDARQFLNFNARAEGGYEIRSELTGPGKCMEVVFIQKDGWHYTYMAPCDPGNWAQQWDISVVNGEYVQVTNWSLEADLCLDSMAGEPGGEGFWLTMTPCGPTPSQTWIGTKTGRTVSW